MVSHSYNGPKFNHKLKNTNSMLPQMEFHKRNKVNMQDINLLIISNHLVEDSDRYIVKRRYNHKPCIWVKNECEETSLHPNALSVGGMGIDMALMAHSRQEFVITNH